MELYWYIGKIIIENTKYGTKFVDNLSRDILSEFPDIQGFSVRNLKYMRKFAEVYPDFQKVQQGVALLPWRNNLTLFSKINDEAERQWYKENNHGFEEIGLHFNHT
jgi:predicted nuclease of restriction endonuclease-like (RecB) superfamily